MNMPKKNKKTPEFWSQEKYSSLSGISSSRTDGKKKTRHFLVHTWHYIRRMLCSTALPLDSQGVLKYI